MPGNFQRKIKGIDHIIELDDLLGSGSQKRQRLIPSANIENFDAFDNDAHSVDSGRTQNSDDNKKKLKNKDN